MNILHDDWTPLQRASYNGHKEIVILLLEAKADPNLADKDGWTPLRFASLSGHKEVVVSLLAAGADPNLVDDCGKTPLRSAAYNGHKEIVVLLLAAKADPNLADKDGKTPLDIAKERNYYDIVKILEEHIKNKTLLNDLKPENSIKIDIFEVEIVHENIPYKFKGTQSQFEVFRKSIIGK